MSRTENSHFWVRVEWGIRRFRVPGSPDHSLLREAHLIDLKLQVAPGSRVHVGSGSASLYRGRPLMLNARTSTGHVIPGSTLKGAVAHYFTAIFRDMKLTSKLFGSPGYMSRAIFSDAEADRDPEPFGVDPSWTPRIRGRGIKVYRPDIQLVQTDAPAHYVEAFPPGTNFRTKISILNPEKTEMETGRLLTAMGVLPGETVPFLLGFGRPKGMGKVMVVRDSLKVVKIYPTGASEDVTSEVLGSLQEIYDSREREIREVFALGNVQ